MSDNLLKNANAWGLAWGRGDGISNGNFTLQDMWLGVLHHVVGEHVWSDGQCSHGPLTASETAKPQLEKGSKAMEALTKVVFDKKWLKSLIFYVWFK